MCPFFQEGIQGAVKPHNWAIECAPNSAKVAWPPGSSNDRPLNHFIFSKKARWDVLNVLVEFSLE